MQFVDLYAQHQSIKQELDDAIQDVILCSAFVRGDHIDEFERRYAGLMGVKHCISCANGTDAIYIALRALGIESGDEVITTAHSWISTSETITQAGARVVFCDTEDDFFCIDAGQIQDKITDKTKGIIVVHLYGQSADMDAIMEIARANNLWVIEDCAQAHLAEYKGKKVGTIGDVGTYSFYPGKNLGAMGDAGCLVTNHEDIAEYASLFARHGGKNNHVMEGINSRMDGLQAAILNVKMKRLAAWTKIRQKLAVNYDELFSSVVQVKAPAVRENTSHVYHLYVIRSPNRDELKDKLKEQGIPTIINYPKALPYYQAYAYLGHTQEEFPVARRHSEQILSLPMHPFLSDEEQGQVVEAVSDFFQDK
jgi:dTDP-4-amino-4,6-dideoxygalactose transaminase